MRITGTRGPNIRHWLALSLAVAGFACNGDEQGETLSEQTQPEPALLQDVLAAGCDSDLFFDALGPYLAAADSAGERTSEQFDAYIDSLGSVPFQQLYSRQTTEVLSQNEVHDCQRLIVRDVQDALVYGPLVHITLRRDEAHLPIGPGRVMSELYNFSAQDYPQLGIRPGVNCLWMQPVEPDAEEWNSFMLQPASGTCQTTTQNDVASGTLLRTVRRTSSSPQPSPGSPDVYPRTARWMWSGADSVQYIGIRCEEAWCEVTPVGLGTPVAPYPNSMALPGWRDEQLLGYVVGGDLTVSRLTGEIEPAAAVQYPNPPAQVTGLKAAGLGGQPAARIFLRGNDSAARTAYQEKLGIAVTPNESGVSTGLIFMRIRTESAVDVWEGWTQHLPGQIRVLNLAVNDPHSGLGTVRWRWYENDERGWLPCREGCCTWYED